MTIDRIVLDVSRARPSIVPTLLARGRRNGFQNFVVAPKAALSPRAGERCFRRSGTRLLPIPPSGPSGPVESRRISSPEALARAIRRTPTGGRLLLTWSNDRVIPLEAALAAASGRIEIWVEARGPDDMPAALGALEHGAKCALVPIRSARAVETLAASFEPPAPARIRWTRARIRAVRPIGLSERVLVDTVSILSEDEGLLIGSTAHLLFHVLSESIGSRFSAARPFRVNAGAPHSYVLMADGSTRYLSELVAGDPVLVVRADGSSRPVRIGRIKIERRPMLLVAATLGDVGATLFAQEAETVCLAVGARRVAVTELRTGWRVRTARLPPGRHLGRIVEESIEER